MKTQQRFLALFVTVAMLFSSFCFSVSAEGGVAVGTAYDLKQSGFGTSTDLGQFALYKTSDLAGAMAGDASKLVPLTELYENNYYPAGDTEHTSARSFYLENGEMRVYSDAPDAVTPPDGFIIEFTAPDCGQYTFSIVAHGDWNDGNPVASIYKRGAVLSTVGVRMQKSTPLSATTNIGVGEKVYVTFKGWSPATIEAFEVKYGGAGHDHVLSSEIQSTYETQGTKTYTCSCGDSYSETLPLATEPVVSVGTVFSIMDFGVGTNTFLGPFGFYGYDGNLSAAQNAMREQGTAGLVPLNRLSTSTFHAFSGNGIVYDNEALPATEPMLGFKDGSIKFFTWAELHDERTDTTAATPVIAFTSPACGKYSVTVDLGKMDWGSPFVYFYKNGEDIEGVAPIQMSDTSDAAPVTFELELLAGDVFYVAISNTNQEPGYIQNITLECTELLHTYETEVKLPSTYNKTGIMEYTCTLCGFKYEDTIAVLDPSGLSNGQTFSLVDSGFAVGGSLGQFALWGFNNYKSDGTLGNYNDIVSALFANLVPLDKLVKSTTAPADGYAYSEAEIGAEVTFHHNNDGVNGVAITLEQTYLISFQAPTCGSYKLVFTAPGSSRGTSQGRFYRSNGQYLGTTPALGGASTTEITVALGAGEIVYLLFTNADREPIHFTNLTATLISDTGSTHNYDIKKVIKPATFTEEGIVRTFCDCGAYVEETVPVLSTERLAVGDVFSLKESGFGTAPTLGMFGFYAYNGNRGATANAIKDGAELIPVNNFAPFYMKWPVQGGSAYYADGHRSNFYKTADGRLGVLAQNAVTQVITFTAPICGIYDINIKSSAGWWNFVSKITVLAQGENKGDTPVFGTTPTDTTVTVSLKENETVYLLIGNGDSEPIFLDDITVTYKADHSWVLNETFEESTCTQEGSGTYNCACGETKTDVIPVIDHTPAEAVRENDGVEGTDGYDMVIRCTVCNEIISSEHFEVAKVNAANVEISDRFTLFFLVDTATIDDVVNGGGSFEFKIEFEGASIVYNDITKLTKNGERYLFYAEALGAQLMGREFTATLTLTTVGGTTYVSKPTTYSVKQYINNKLAELTAASTAKDIAFRAALADMLVYGAAAQTYARYDIENLVNKEAEKYQQYATSTEQTYTSRYAAYNKDMTYKWKSVNVLLNDGINLLYTIKIPKGIDVNNVSVHATKAGQTAVVYSGADFTPAGGDDNWDFYQVVVKVNLSEVDTVVESYIYKGETKVSGILRYSVESYAAAKASADTDFGKLIDSMMKFGRSIRTWTEQ